LLVKELKRGVVYLVAVLSLGTLVLAYQLRVPLNVDVGSAGDQHFLSGFHDPERSDGLSYRWSSGLSTIRLRGVATWTPVELTLRLNGSRLDELPSPSVVVVASGREVGPLQTTDQFETYRLRLPPDVVGIRGDLVIQIHCDGFVPLQITGTDDQRELGVLVDSVAARPIRGATRPVVPPLRQCLSLVLAIVGAYLWTRQLGLSTRHSLIAAGLCLLAVATLVVRCPLQLGLCDRWPVPLLAAAIVATILYRSVRSRWTWEQQVSGEASADLRLLLVCALAIAAVLYAWNALWQPLTEDRATDFFINYAATTVLAGGGDIYDPAALNEACLRWDQPVTTFECGSLFATYITPFFHAVILLPLVPLGHEKARLGFLALSNLLLFSSLALVLRASERALRKVPWVLLTVLVVLLFRPVYSSMELGQVDFVILFLISLAYWAHLTDRKLIVGPALALAAMIKLSPAALLVYFLWKREFAIVASAAITGIVCTTISLVVAGTQPVLRFATEIAPALLKGTAFFQNQSLNGFFSRLLVDPALHYSLGEFTPPPAVRVLTLLSSVAVLLAVAYLTRPRRSPLGIRFPYEFALALGSLLLVSSISWDHYYVWLLPGFWVLLGPSLREHLSKTRYRTLMACYCGAYLLMIIPTHWYGMALHEYSGTRTLQTALTLLGSLKVYGLMLFSSCLALLLLGLDPNQSLGRRAIADANVSRVSP
jgi:hypothetical protein